MSSALVPGATREILPSDVTRAKTQARYLLEPDPELVYSDILQGSVQEVAAPVSQEAQSEEALLLPSPLCPTPGLMSGSATNCQTVTLTSSARELQEGVSTQ